VYRGGDRAAVAALAPVVIAAAEDRDRAAEGIVGEAVAELAAAAAAAARRLGLGVSFPVALAGGLFAGSPGFRDRFLAALAKLGLQADPVALVTEPAEGAVRLALDKLAVPN
jgi:N-acetylglucosamine kinase-like BadF-type ATPase